MSQATAEGIDVHFILVPLRDGLVCIAHFLRSIYGIHNDLEKSTTPRKQKKPRNTSTYKQMTFNIANFKVLTYDIV